MVVLNVSLQFALFVFLGIFIIRIRLVEASFRTQLSKFVMNIALPCLIANSFRSQTFDGDFRPLLDTLGLCIGVMALLFCAGEVIYLLLKRTELAQTARFATVFGNFTFVGYAVAQSLYGADGLFVYTLFTLPVRLVFYASPAFLLAPKTGEKKKIDLRSLGKSLISAPTVAVFIGLFFYFTGCPLPDFMDAAVRSLAATSSPLGMLICGMSLASTTLKTVWQRRKIFWAVLCSNFVAPALILLLLLCVKVDAPLQHTALLFGAVPAPSLLTTFSITQKRSEEACADASAVVLISTLLSIGTLPLWISLAEALL